MYQQPSSPQTIGGVLDSGFKLYRECFVQVFLLAALASLVTAPSNYAGVYLAQNLPTPGVILSLVGAGLLMAVVAVVLFGAIIARVDGVARGAPVAVGDALSIGVNRMLSMIGSAFVAGIAIVVGCILLVIPGLIVMVFLLFGPYAVIIERMGPLESLGYSRALVRGHWWRTAALLTIIGIILTVFYIVLLTVAGFAVFSNPETLATGQMPWYIQFVVGPVLSAVGAPLAYSLLLSIYYDLKLRHEGGDLAARIAATA